MKACLLILLGIASTIWSGPKTEGQLYTDVIQAIVSGDSVKLDSISNSDVFSYFEGDTELDPKEVEPQYYLLDSNGYYGKEYSLFIKKSDFVRQNTKDCNIVRGGMNFQISPMRKVSVKRCELIIDPFCDVSKMHFVLLRFSTGWKLAGSYFEAANTERPRREKGRGIGNKGK